MDTNKFRLLKFVKKILILPKDQQKIQIFRPVLLKSFASAGERFRWAKSMNKIKMH